MSDVISAADIGRALKSLMQAPKAGYGLDELLLHPWEDRKYGDDFRSRGYRVIVIGKSDPEEKR